MLNSVLFIFSLFLIVRLLSPVQLYGSTILCDPSLNLTNCDERSSLLSSTSDTETTDNSQSDNTETPLIIPDISTSKDLDDAMTDGDLGTTDTDVNNDNDDSENSIDENSDTDTDDDKDSSNSEGG